MECAVAADGMSMSLDPLRGRTVSTPAPWLRSVPRPEPVEPTVADELDELGPEAFGVRLATGEVDGLVVSGATGVFLVETGHERHYDSYALATAARRAGELGPGVTPVIALDCAVARRPELRAGVWIVPRAGLGAWLHGFGS
jgi:hypothetical protein